MAVENFISPAFTITLVFSIIRLGSFKGSNMGAQLTGDGTTSANSDWKLVQSNDAINWVDVAGATFTDIGDETKSVELAGAFTMLFLGLEKVSGGTESTGTVQLNATFKE